MSQPLNPALFNALNTRMGGSVIISNPGATYSPGSFGEYYAVCCPMCHDTRHRLWICHMFGRTTIENGRPNQNLHLMICYNEGCYPHYADRKLFYDRLFPFNYHHRIGATKPSAAELGPAPTVPAIVAVAQPPDLISLDDPRAARAADYLASRGFDSAEIMQKWGAMYCLRQERIAVPVHHLRGTLQGGLSVGLTYDPIVAGWQYRYIGEPSAQTPKYLTARGTPKSRLLYGLPHATGIHRRDTPLTVVEGVTDVWRMGNDAVATLGKSISPQQIQLLLLHAQYRPIVVAYDDDAQKAAHVAAILIRATFHRNSRKSKVSVISLPSGRKDIGECSREEAWKAVWAACS